MNEYKETSNQVQNLQSVQASSKLRQRIHGLTFVLPAQPNNTYFQAFAFKTAIALGVLLLFVGMGSGIVDGAKNSKPGSPLFPVRQAIENVQSHMPFVATVEKKVVTPTPTAIPTKAVYPTPTSTESQEKHDKSDDKTHEEPKQESNSLQNAEKDVKGIEDANRQSIPFWKTNKQEHADTNEKNGSDKPESGFHIGPFFFRTH